MKLAFMSSVCPKMSLAELIAAAKTHGFQGIEFRPEWNHGHGVELTASATDRVAVRRRMGDEGIEPCCISPGTKFCHEDATLREADFAKLTRYIDLAADIGIGRIRVFGDPLPNTGCSRRAMNYRIQADYLAKAAEKAAAAGLKLAIETHVNFRGFDAGEVLFQAGYPSGLCVNWHLAHTLKHGEDVDETYRHIKGRIGHAHFSIDEKESELPLLKRQRELLAGEDFDGYFSVEVINPPESLPVLVRHAAAWTRMRA
jgi:sugar phosphate isomerase/epimerase